MMKAFIRRRYKILISYFNSELNGDYMENKMVRNLPISAIPTEVGIHVFNSFWIPAAAGMTNLFNRLHAINKGNFHGSKVPAVGGGDKPS